MQVVALISGGKDSSFNLLKCQEAGHQVVALANLYPAEPDTEELDSYMYQSVGHQVIELVAKCYGLPLYRRKITGKPLSQTLDYSDTPGDEVEDLFELLKQVKQAHPDIKGVSSGAIFSTYQKNRVEQVCSRLGLTSLAFLWEREQVALLDEIISSGIEAVIIKTAVLGLDKRHLGRSLSDIRDELVKYSQDPRMRLNPCGEGGEYETLTLNSPLYVKGFLRLESIVENDIRIHDNNASAPVYYLSPRVQFIPK